MSATISLYLRKDRPNNNGKCPVFLRITHNRKTKYVSTGVRVKPKNWNPATKTEKWVSKGDRDHATLNNDLRKELSKAKKARAELNRQDQVSSIAIQRRLKSDTKDDFFSFAEKYQEKIKEKSYYTWKQNRVAIEKVRKYHESDDLPLKYIDAAFLMKLIEFMQSKPYSNKASTIHKNFGAIRAILDRAVLEKFLPENPMDDPAFKLPKGNGSEEKTKLTNEQIQAIEDLNIQPWTNLWHARNAFIMSFYFYGIRIGDLCMLRWSNVKNERLKYTMSKTGNPIDVKIPSGAYNLLYNYIESPGKYVSINKYEQIDNIYVMHPINHKLILSKHVIENFLNTTPDDYIFPFLSELTPKQRKDPEQVRRKISTWTSIINGSNTSSDLAGLKKIAQMAEIDAEISMHVARHSFAQFAVEKKDVPTYKLMILLGHQSIKTTMQYLKKLNVEAADDAADAIFDS